METKHTKGEWIRDGKFIYSLIQDGWNKGEPQMVNKFWLSVDGHKHITVEEIEANAKLIAAAPLMLKELILTYLRLQIESLKDKDMKLAVITDYMRASLRNKVAKILDIEDVVLQSEIESIASDFVNGKIDFNEAVKKATE